MSNPWRETKGYSFHSICFHVKDISLSATFYEEVLGMSVVREANLGHLSKVWLQFPSNKSGRGFGLASSLIELVQKHGTEWDDHFDVQANAGGFHHITCTVPDIISARQRFEKLGVAMDELGVSPKYV